MIIILDDNFGLSSNICATKVNKYLFQLMPLNSILGFNKKVCKLLLSWYLILLIFECIFFHFYAYIRFFSVYLNICLVLYAYKSVLYLLGTCSKFLKVTWK